ncbi:ABC transporter ATP-binding protein [Paenactinomyces guangxiensis]|uniref:ABC transporter ATP-binding protein n=1 Tax=Paenactinomyces guangxiensis TaxID=1490290 RepID=UPI001E3A1874|nr:ABC transporter ATP-binding protein [Paenactinomyces guangxiensis]
MDSSIVETVNLTKQYKNHIAVNKLNLKVEKGEIYGFLGPNGAGKTTTIRMLLGLIRPTQGEVRLFGKDLRQHRMSILGKVGSLVETPSYYGHLTGFENLEAARRLLRVPDKKRVDQVLDIVRLKQAKDRKVKDYSLGMKQRLGIATTLLNQPQLLILDEPTNGLDPAGIQEIRELIREMPEKYEMSVLVSSHLLSEVDQIATQVGIIHHGNLIFQGSIDMLRKESRAWFWRFVFLFPFIIIGVELLLIFLKLENIQGLPSLEKGASIWGSMWMVTYYCNFIAIHLIVTFYASGSCQYGTPVQYLEAYFFHACFKVAILLVKMLVARYRYPVIRNCAYGWLLSGGGHFGSE